MSVECSLYTLILAVFGCIVIFLFLLNTLWGLMQATRAILAPFFLPHEETSLIKKYGQWALITGSTDGIGKAYAHELAKRGLNIVLVSRSTQRLKNVAKELETEYSIKTKIISADFSLGGQAIEIIKQELGVLDIGIIVNNVGKQYDYPMYLGEVPEQDLWDIINVNVGAVTLLCRLFVEDMKRKGRGAIVNVSSGSELQPLPLMTVYAATKAYIKSFTAALRYEYSKHGLTIQHLSPMFINTKMNHFSQTLRESSTFIPDASTYARHAVSTLGKMDESTGYWAHGIQYFFTSIPPVWIRMYIGGYMNKIFRNEYFILHKQNPETTNKVSFL
ncbi:hydroxysteroid dehydrogenase-like protein 1 [Tribolium madens]|uniref:hydroxysteroid dehydrogenase-like protein 1 n=1 Tax=Tribolium madens TaxID=41895 RepID=UPI001CF75F9F|nr:hydroxysteroid dehydrogenase-like protein 1 [Tribolium madens]XP_044267594.1 hydroxysteroid dehydrogenase-like protein 1 [Tribolium madens]